jgi:hypothetical protein
MESMKVGIREFRADLADFIATSAPMADCRAFHVFEGRSFSSWHSSETEVGVSFAGPCENY